MNLRISHNKKKVLQLLGLALQLQVSHWLKQNSNYLQVAITLTPTMGISGMGNIQQGWGKQIGKQLDQGLTLRYNP